MVGTVWWIDMGRTRVNAKHPSDSRSALAMSAPMELSSLLDEQELVSRHVEGYRRMPLTPNEFSILESDRAWGDETWDGE